MLFLPPPLDGAAAPRRSAAQKVEVLHLLHCLSEGTGSGSAARSSVIPSLSPAHSLSRPPWRPQKASSPAPAASKKKKKKNSDWASLFIYFFSLAPLDVDVTPPSVLGKYIRLWRKRAFSREGGKYGAGQVPLPVCVSVCQCALKGSDSTCLRRLALSLWEYLCRVVL